MSEHSEVVNMVAICKARPGREVEMLALLQLFVQAARTEVGCLSYLLHANKDDATEFVFYETWTNQNALDLHFALDCSKQLIEQLQPLLAGPPQLYRLKCLT